MVAHHVERIEITPDTAREWLISNTRNRPLKPAKIAGYARDMADGRWKFTGEAIKFDTDGALLDGQNRLHAIVESGATVESLVVYGLEPETQDVMDSGAPRRVSDALAMHGYKNSKDLAAVVQLNRHWRAGRLRNCMTRPDGRENMTHAEAVKYAEENPGLVDVTHWAAGFRPSLALPIASVANAKFALSSIDYDDADEFFTRIAELRTTGHGDPIFTLVKRVGEMRERKQSIFPTTGLYMLIRSWNACRQGEPLLKFQFGSEMRGWAPMPDPV